MGKSRRLSLPTSFSSFYDCSTEKSSELHSVGIGNDFASYPFLRREMRTRATFLGVRRFRRWHIHCAIELPAHCDAIGLERLIRACWAKVEWACGRILVRDGADAGWIDYMLKADRRRHSTACLTV